MVGGRTPVSVRCSWKRAQIFRRRGVGRAAEEGCESLDVPDIVVAASSRTKLRTLMSSIMRWRSGLMGFSLIAVLLS